MQNQTRNLVFAALLAALSTVLGGPLSIPLNLFGGYMKSISFACVPVILAACMLGPVYGGLTGAVSDLLTFLTVTRGAYFPGFTISYALFGVLVAVLFRRVKTGSYPRILLSTALPYVLCFTVMNSVFLVAFFGLSPSVIFIRAAIQCVMVPVYALLARLLMQAARPFITA